MGRIAGQGRLGDAAAGQIDDRGFDAVAVAPAVAGSVGGHAGGHHFEVAEIHQLAGGGQAAGLHHAEGGAGSDPLAQQGRFDAGAHQRVDVAQQSVAPQAHQLAAGIGRDPEHRVGGGDVDQLRQQGRLAGGELGEQIVQAGGGSKATEAAAGHRAEQGQQLRRQIAHQGVGSQLEGLAAAGQHEHRALAPTQVHLHPGGIIGVTQPVEALAAHQQVVAGAPQQGVVVEATDQGVVAAAALHSVGAAQADDQIVALLAQQDVGVAINIAADQGVITQTAIEIHHRHGAGGAAAPQQVVAVTAGEHPEEFGQAGEGILQPVAE